MKRNINSLIGFTIGATDGEIGEVTDFYFDDKTWTIRYLVVKTGSWLFGRKVLLSPKALLAPDWENEVFPVNLTMEQVKGSPDIDTEMPVSRQNEMDLYNYYPWGGYYWNAAMGTSGMGISYPIGLSDEDSNEHNTYDNDKSGHDMLLRSTDAVTAYAIQAIDGEIGEVEDFIIDDDTWTISFLEVDTGNWFPGKKVLIAPKWIKEINWKNTSVIVNASEEEVKNSPEYIPAQAVSDAYEASLMGYYGRLIRRD